MSTQNTVNIQFQPKIKLKTKSKPKTLENDSNPVLNTPNDEIIDPFLISSLENPKDRLTLLKFDKELERFMKNKSKNRLQFPHMTSYHRRIAHRVADYFKLKHIAQTNEKGDPIVVLYKTKNSLIPILRFSDLCEELAPESDKNRNKGDNVLDSNSLPYKIMKREDKKVENEVLNRKMGKAKFEMFSEKRILNKEEEYKKAREKIFGREEREDCCELGDKSGELKEMDEDIKNKNCIKEKEIGFLEDKKGILGNEEITAVKTTVKTAAVKTEATETATQKSSKRRKNKKNRRKKKKQQEKVDNMKKTDETKNDKTKNEKKEEDKELKEINNDENKNEKENIKSQPEETKKLNKPLKCASTHGAHLVSSDQLAWESSNQIEHDLYDRNSVNVISNTNPTTITTNSLALEQSLLKKQPNTYPSNATFVPNPNYLYNTQPFIQQQNYNYRPQIDPLLNNVTSTASFLPQNNDYNNMTINRDNYMYSNAVFDTQMEQYNGQNVNSAMQHVPAINQSIYVAPFSGSISFQTQMPFIQSTQTNEKHFQNTFDYSSMQQFGQNMQPFQPNYNSSNITTKEQQKLILQEQQKQLLFLQQQQQLIKNQLEQQKQLNEHILDKKESNNETNQTSQRYNSLSCQNKLSKKEKTKINENVLNVNKNTFSEHDLSNNTIPKERKTYKPEFYPSMTSSSSIDNNSNSSINTQNTPLNKPKTIENLSNISNPQNTTNQHLVYTTQPTNFLQNNQNYVFDNLNKLSLSSSYSEPLSISSTNPYQRNDDHIYSRNMSYSKKLYNPKSICEFNEITKKMESENDSEGLLFDYSSEKPSVFRPYIAPTEPNVEAPTHILEIFGFSKKYSRFEMDNLLLDVKNAGGRIKWLDNSIVLAIFTNTNSALNALNSIKSDNYLLRRWNGRIK